MAKKNPLEVRNPDACISGKVPGSSESIERVSQVLDTSGQLLELHSSDDILLIIQPVDGTAPLETTLEIGMMRRRIFQAVTPVASVVRERNLQVALPDAAARHALQSSHV